MAFKRHHFQPDTPTNVFATLNPLYTRGALSNGNLEHTSTSTYSTATSTFLIPSSVPIYFEVYVKSVNATNIGVMRGYGNIDQNLYIGYDPSVKLFGISYRNNGDIYGDSEGAGTAEAASSGAATDGYTTGDIVGVFVDISSNTLKFYKTNTLVFTSDLKKYDWYAAASSYNSAVNVVNFGQDPTFSGNKTDSTGPYTDANGQGKFYYQPPAGALALCTENLPVTPITAHLDEEPGDYFKAVTYVGDGTDTKEVTVGFVPDLCWFKDRDTPNYHTLIDSLRGGDRHIYSHRTDVDRLAGDGTDGVLDFNSGGTNDKIKIGYHDGWEFVNKGGNNYIGWFWKAGGSTGKYNVDGKAYASAAKAGFGAGTITPLGASVNIKAGFSIVKYEGNGSTGAKIAHGLNSAPEMIILKGLENTYQWETQHKDISLTGAGIHLDSATKYNKDASDRWNSQRADSKVVTVSNNGAVNESGKDYIMYAWHSVPGYSKIGSYAGNGSPDGTFVYTGFKPAFILYKSTTTEQYWHIHDTKRDPYNPVTHDLYPNLSNKETDYTTDVVMDILSNGFKFRSSNGAWNADDVKFIYMAFAEKPQTPASRVTIPKPEIKANDMRSMYFDGSDTYLKRDFGNGTETWTFSSWVKKTSSNSWGVLFASCHNGSNRDVIRFRADDGKMNYQIIHSSTNFELNTNGKYEDLSSWYHILVQIRHVSRGERIGNLYVNGKIAGSLPDSWGSDIDKPGYPSINQGGRPHYIGARSQDRSAIDSYFEGYMANIHFIDGQVLEPSAFIETVNDVLIPKQYEGTYGTNGFHLDFAPENIEYSGDTITRVLDESPNSNHWTAH